MKKLLGGAALAAMALAFTATPAAAGSPTGNVQVKLMGAVVDPDGGIDSVEFDGIGLPAGTDTRADTSVIPLIAAELFLTPNVSLETICCVTTHDVAATSPAALAGAGLVSDAHIVPATLTAKYHFNPGGISPYVGVGGSYFIFIDEQPGAVAQALGATRQQMNDHFGFVLQAGVDVPLNQNGLGLTLDVRRYFVTTTATWFNAAGNTVLQTRHNIDPWVFGAGLSYRF